MSYFLATREEIEEHEKKILAAYACHAADSRGREYYEEPDFQRTCYQRDRDRVIHCRAYRRLKGKTQVFVSHHGDHFRNRLTHTLEVVQLTRDITRNLRGNEDLAETIALAHDIGHTPFAHAGQEAMQELLHRYDLYFEHNQQSRRIVEVLEQKSPFFRGLNLSWEVRDGLMKHRYSHNEKDNREMTKNGCLEAQVADIADQIAYNNHDIDDGLRSGIITLEDLNKIDIWREALEKNALKNQSEKIWVSQCISALIKLMADNLLSETAHRVERINPRSHEDIRNAPFKIVSFSPDMEQKLQALRNFLYSCFYRQKEVVKQSERGQQIIKKIFFYLMDHPEKMPDEFWHMVRDGERKEIIVKDFIAGMTDQFALDFSDQIDGKK